MTDAAVAAVTRRPRASKLRRIGGRLFKRLPYAVVILILYVIIEASVPNMRDIIFTTSFMEGTYAMTWVEVILVLGAGTALFELLRVSKPGIDNTWEIISMLIFWIFCLFLVMLAGRFDFLMIFRTTEFIMLLVYWFLQIIVAFLINARTLKKTIDYTSKDDASGYGEH